MNSYEKYGTVYKAFQYNGKESIENNVPKEESSWIKGLDPQKGDWFVRLIESYKLVSNRDFKAYYRLYN